MNSTSQNRRDLTAELSQCSRVVRDTCAVAIAAHRSNHRHKECQLQRGGTGWLQEVVYLKYAQSRANLETGHRPGIVHYHQLTPRHRFS